MTQSPDSFDSSIPTLTDVVVPGKPEYARVVSLEEAIQYDAGKIADGLRTQVSQFLSADVRSLIEARCQDALRQQSAQIAQAITREVTSALEGRLQEWVAAAVKEELRRHREA